MKDRRGEEEEKKFIDLSLNLMENHFIFYLKQRDRQRKGEEGREREIMFSSKGI